MSWFRVTSLQDLEAVHEVISWAMDIRQGSSGTKLRKDALPASMDMRGALQELTGTEEPLWASDDCPIIRCLPLYNQLRKLQLQPYQGVQLFACI